MTTTKLTYRSFLLQYTGWWVGWVLLQTLVLYYTAEVDLKSALLDGAITNGILGLAGYELIVVMRYFQPRQSLRFIWSVALAIGCTALTRWIIQLVISEPDYIDFVDKWLIVRSLFSWLILSFITAISWMWFYMKEQQENELRNADMEKLAKEAELTMLRQQLQPHFLFNSLNSISALVGSRPEEARTMIQQLSDFLRGTIKRDDQSMITLQEEIHHLHLYLAIEKVRFGHRLKTVITKENEAENLKLPALLLQPIVENAIKFGLYDTLGDITISVDARREGGNLYLSVTNPFDPQTSRPKQGTGFGLSSINRRLHLLFGRSDLLTTSQLDNHFKTEVRIPQL